MRATGPVQKGMNAIYSINRRGGVVRIAISQAYNKKEGIQRYAWATGDGSFEPGTAREILDVLRARVPNDFPHIKSIKWTREKRGGREKELRFEDIVNGVLYG